MRLTMGGSENHRILVAVVKPSDEARMMMVVDYKGRITFANAPLAALLGYKLPQLKTKELAALLAPPYDVLHSKWLKVAARRRGTGDQGHAGDCAVLPVHRQPARRLPGRRHQYGLPPAAVRDLCACPPPCARRTPR